MDIDDITLETRFPARIRFWAHPLNRIAIANYRERLRQRGIVPRTEREGDDLVLAFRVSIEQALALGWNRYAPDELRCSLQHAFPELRQDDAALRRRIRTLEQRFAAVAAAA